MKNFVIYIVALICSLNIAGCKFDEIKSVTTTGELNIEVDENVEKLMRDEIKEFERLNPEAKIKMKSVPTRVAKADLINGESKLIVVTRNFTEEEKSVIEKNKITVKEYPIAIDGIGFIVNLKNPIKRVTSEDLKDIFTGKYKNWTDLKSEQDADQNIEVRNFSNRELIKSNCLYKERILLLTILFLTVF
ncbi:MAG TPA: substrate-binding domain-containing protein [Ignavibacteria bacterium]|nr:substrate-binding domain-containing protein [Ignavibacteria bacterium]